MYGDGVGGGPDWDGGNRVDRKKVGAEMSEGKLLHDEDLEVMEKR